MARLPHEELRADTEHGGSQTRHGTIQPEPVLAQLKRIAELNPEIRDILDHWLQAKVPMEQTLVLIIRELSDRLSQTESAFRAVVQDLRRTDRV